MGRYVLKSYDARRPLPLRNHTNLTLRIVPPLVRFDFQQTFKPQAEQFVRGEGECGILEW